VSVESRPGRTVFVVTLPPVPPEERVPEVAEPLAAPEPATARM
jgi:hypothetical protein